MAELLNKETELTERIKKGILLKSGKAGKGIAYQLTKLTNENSDKKFLAIIWQLV